LRKLLVDNFARAIKRAPHPARRLVPWVAIDSLMFAPCWHGRPAEAWAVASVPVFEAHGRRHSRDKAVSTPRHWTISLPTMSATLPLRAMSLGAIAGPCA
jgi:hypothetical protein